MIKSGASYIERSSTFLVLYKICFPRIGSTHVGMLGSVELPMAIIAAFFIIVEPANGL
ncbi:hypothetical protein [Paenibacillus anseongense]|uniref:hypothetical protein n=1 Tax=Paenibacillus anseongense TaxID=2682845 RepID=UPI002DB92FCC|nr:hypothetical protein [Paenibacillus anseongense]MEC0271191.1 hypothetical protein [Paenibacillus anseongense]